MKQSQLLTLFLLTGMAPLAAQTNIFPATGNVGIGTTSPGAVLHVNGSVLLGSSASGLTSGFNGEFGNPMVGNSGGFRFNKNSATAGAKVFSSFHANSGIEFYHEVLSAIDSRFIFSGGNVGIGTTSPQAKLHILDTATVSPRNIIADQISDDSSGWQLNIRKARGTVSAPAALLGGDAIFNMCLSGYDGASYGTSANIRVVAAANWSTSSRPAYLQFYTTNLNETGASERMRISEAGNIGIGTTGPGAKLEVYAPVAEAIRIRGDNSYLAFFDTAGLRQGYLQGSTGNVILASDSGVVAVNSGGAERMRVIPTGNVGIGTSSPTHKLSVNGTIRAKEVIVDTGWSDYVFDDGYRLAPLSEVETHIRDKKHLPGIPSAAEVAQGGVSLGDMQARLLAKVEELMLYAIELKKENEGLKARVAALEAQ